MTLIAPMQDQLEDDAPETVPDCERVLNEIADWVDQTYKGASSLIAMIATDAARVNAAETIMGRYRQSPVLQGLLDQLSINEVSRRSGVHDALVVLSKRPVFADKITKYLAQKGSESFKRAT